ncbi:MAG TPA: globin [Phycisphaerales bacterium]|nr:globin [Phycisphaerales bacterium]
MSSPTPTPSASPTVTTRRQRLATFNARHSHELFSIARAFVDRLAPVFPPVVRLMRLADKTSRFDFGCAVSTLCKHADDLSAVAPMVETIGGHLHDNGFTASHAPAARAAFMDALRECCGPDWTPEMERDWSEVCADFFARMNLRAPAMPARRAPLSMAA